jgi:ribulose-phosphate 3-epimerase
MLFVAPSLLSCNFLRLEEECKMVNESQADWFHVDVMDGRFVPNITWGFPIIQQIKTVAKKPLDVHLMIVEPEKYAENFKAAGADILTVHLEACTHLHRNIQQIKSLGMKAGVALNPHTSVHLLENIIADVDVVCVMSVNPGFGGQEFIPHSFDKIKDLKRLILQHQSPALIEVDGGVTLHNAKALLAAGVDVLVTGNTVFKSSNPIETIAMLKNQ